MIYMLRTLFLLTIGLLFFYKNNAQKKTDGNLSNKDSLEILNQLRSLLDPSDQGQSYLFANIGIGNRLFSMKNAALNAKQSTTNVIIYSPSLGYFHKTGLGLTAGASLLKEVDGFGANQFSLSPSFDLTGNKNIAFGISYTHYFVKNKFSLYASPVQNDLYTSLRYKKSWLQPGIAIGYSTGEYKEAKFKDTVIAGIRRRFYDSATYKLTAFSLMFSAGHQFTWYNVLNKLDGVSFTPTLIANAGSGKTTISHKTNAIALFNFLNKRGRIPKLQTDQFEMQSMGLNLDLAYNVGNFTFEPQWYLDFYLPATDSQRWSQVFTFNVGYTF